LVIGHSAALRLIFSRAAAFLPVGSANAAYFRHHGVPPEKLFPAPHAVDAEHFAATPARLAAAAAQRAALGIPADAPVVLFAGKFIPKKRPDLLLAAFLRAAVPGAHLVLAGDGELAPALRAAAAGRADVHFLPFANQSAMPARYLLGDVFALPSEGRHETWGLAVNEAMHLGRPALVSDHVGCHPDLILPHSTGWTFPAGDEAALAALLRDLLARSRCEVAAAGEAARRHAAAFSYQAATAGLLRALASLRLLPTP
jgi:glycosyltransferase involved in cell wall biosynthesis